MADLISVSEASALISTGRALLIAGDAAALSQLPKGQWIGGTTQYFMSRTGGVTDREQVFVTQLVEPITSSTIRIYGTSELERIPEDYPEHGCSFIILPASSPVHLRFACECTDFLGLFNSPLIGWNAGAPITAHLSYAPSVFDGATLRTYDNAAAVMHTTLHPDYVARIEIINPFHQGQGDAITFPKTGFTITDCSVNGNPRNFADYITQHSIDTRWPLVADFAGAQLNVSFRAIDAAARQVHLYAPVVAGVEYRIAEPVADLAEFFGREFAARRISPAFSCNCILNFLYAQLEGKRTGEARGPFTFGEIAYVQLNQTLVYVALERAA